MPSTPDLHTGLSFESTVRPELLRQRTPEQIFVTDWRLDDKGFTAAVRLPLNHARYSDTCTPHHDIVLMADAISQVGMTAAINLLDAPFEWEFMVRRLDIALDPLQNNVRGRDSAQMTVTTDGGDVGAKVRGNARAGGAGFLTTRNSIEGNPSGTSHASTFWVSEERFRELRRRLRKRLGPGEQAPESLQRETLVGRMDPDNAVISTLQPAGERSYETCVLVDLDDPTFFGRPLDHVNGLLILEAAKQAAIAAACRELGTSPSEVVVSAADISFVSFAELDDLTRCNVTLEDDATAAVTLSQSNRTVARATLTVARL